MITLLVVYTERRLIAYPQFFTGGVPFVFIDHFWVICFFQCQSEPCVRCYWDCVTAFTMEALLDYVWGWCTYVIALCSAVL